MRERPLRLLGGDSMAIEWGRLLAVIVVAVWAASLVIGFIGSLWLLTILGFGLAFFGFARPSIGVLGITMVCTLDALTRHFLTTSGFLRWNTFNYMLLVVMLASALFVLRVADPHSKILKAFAGLLVAELIFSPSLENGVQHVLGIVSLFGLLVYFAQAYDEPDIWYSAGLVNGLSGAVGGLFFYLTRTSLPEINPNVFTFFPETALFCICLGFGRASAHRHGQLVLGLLAIANFSWVFLSGSRGGLLIAAVCMLFVLFAMRSVTQRLTYVAAGIVIAVAISSSFADLEQYSVGRITKLLDDDQSDAARTSGRSDLARAGIHIFERNPLGVGTGGFAVTWSKLGYIPGVSSFKRGEEFQAHSGWIKVLAENGWPGSLLMFAYVGSFAFFGFRARRSGMLGIGLLTSSTLAVAFLSTEFQGKGFWLLAAAATVMLHPVEMARCLHDEVRRFGYRPQRIVGDPAPAAAQTMLTTDR